MNDLHNLWAISGELFQNNRKGLGRLGWGVLSYVLHLVICFRRRYSVFIVIDGTIWENPFKNSRYQVFGHFLDRVQGKSNKLVINRVRVWKADLAPLPSFSAGVPAPRADYNTSVWIYSGVFCFSLSCELQGWREMSSLGANFEQMPFKKHTASRASKYASCLKTVTNFDYISWWSHDQEVLKICCSQCFVVFSLIKMVGK